MSLKGYTLPRTPEGRSSIIPAPPWHYSTNILLVEYRMDPAAARAFLPEDFELGEDPGFCTMFFGEYQSCTDDLHELIDPERSQYEESAITLSCSYKGQPVQYPLYLWVNKDFALARGQIMGLPKKIGSIALTRTFPAGKASPQLAPGGKFGASVSVHGRSIARALITLTQPATRDPQCLAEPSYGTRLFPSYDSDIPAIHELATANNYDGSVVDVWEGDATLKFYDDTVDELEPLRPIEVIAGFRASMGFSMNGGTVVKRYETSS